MFVYRFPSGSAIDDTAPPNRGVLVAETALSGHRLSPYERARKRQARRVYGQGSCAVRPGKSS